MIARRMAAAVAAVALGVLVAVPSTASAAVRAEVDPASPAPGSVEAQSAGSVAGIPGLPTDVPPAATAALPALPEPSSAAWPFPSDFSHTEGTGLVDGGASLWTDFVYDDHGPADSTVGITAQESVTDLALVHGGFTYPTGTGYDDNNADIFRAAVGASAKYTYWRVDWNTLPDASIPVAEWTMTPSGAPATATTATWPGNAGVTTSSGIEYALLVDSAGAELVDAATGAVLGSYTTAVDPDARSFIVKVPTSTLPVSGHWSLQLAAGLSAGTTPPSFATVGARDGGLSGGANVYNITFRTAADESPQVCLAPNADPAVSALVDTLADTISSQLATTATGTSGVPTAPCANSWEENDQANTLAGLAPDVSRYALRVDWSELRSGASVPAMELTGYSNRWYETPLDLSAYGAGVRNADSSTYTGPTYLSRIQPYAVYVPTGYDFSAPSPTPLTWVLHSLGANYNQYGSLAPSQLVQECQDRASICATTEGFSEGQWYYDEAEVDFFDVWHNLALDYDLDPDATTISGYSMGGWASYKLAEEYPDLFAQSMALEGPVICGEEVLPGGSSGPIGSYAGGGQCTSDGQSTPLLADTHWIPYVMTCGGIDQLVPVTGCDNQRSALESLGQRVYEVLYPTEDHLVFATQNDFTPADDQLGRPPLDRESDPGSFTYTWYPDLSSSVVAAGGVDGAGAAGTVGPTRDYWVSGLTGRVTTPGTMATVVARSNAIPDPSITTDTVTAAPGVEPEPTPYVVNALSWTPGATPAAAQTLSLDLTDVATATLDTAAAGLSCATVTATTDGSTALTLSHLVAGSAVTSDPGADPVATAGTHGDATVALAGGTTVLHLCSAGTSGTSGTSGAGGAGAGAPTGLPESPLAIAIPAAGILAGGWALRRGRGRRRRAV